MASGLRSALGPSSTIDPRFESLATTASVFTAFASFSFSKSLSLSLHPSGTIDPNRYWETRELVTLHPISISTGLSVAIGS